MRNALWLVLILVPLVGCATSHKINNISLGMTKQQVVEALGPPVSTSAKTGVEFLNYRFSETIDHAFRSVTTRYFVRIVDGRVDAYGRLGDFEIPETKSTIDLKIRK